jgi:hypothetical protein
LVSKLILSALVAVFALGFVAATGTAQAAPPHITCTGTASVWDDSDIVHLTKEGAGTLILGWSAKGHTTLNCGTGSPLTGQVAQIEQRVQARIGPGGAIRGQAHTRVIVAGRQRSLQGNYIGTAAINAGTLSVQAEVRGDVDGNDFLALRMREHGTINLSTKQWTGFYIDDFIVGLK